MIFREWAIYQAPINTYSGITVGTLGKDADLEELFGGDGQ